MKGAGSPAPPYAIVHPPGGLPGSETGRIPINPLDRHFSHICTSDANNAFDYDINVTSLNFDMRIIT